MHYFNDFITSPYKSLIDLTPLKNIELTQLISAQISFCWLSGIASVTFTAVNQCYVIPEFLNNISLQIIYFQQGSDFYPRSPKRRHHIKRLC